jgi:hypothetical protein
MTHAHDFGYQSPLTRAYVMTADDACRRPDQNWELTNGQATAGDRPGGVPSGAPAPRTAPLADRLVVAVSAFGAAVADGIDVQVLDDHDPLTPELAADTLEAAGWLARNAPDLAAAVVEALTAATVVELKRGQR